MVKLTGDVSRRWRLRQDTHHFKSHQALDWMFFWPWRIWRTMSKQCCARLFRGRTIHNRISLNATSSVKVEHLGLKGETRTKVEKITGPAAALAIDEVSPMSATMLRAHAVRHTHGCAREHGLGVDEYMKVNELFGRIPAVLLSGDYLQLPPVPESSSVLWPALEAACEHRQGETFISSVPMVYGFRKSNRLTEQRLIQLKITKTLNLGCWRCLREGKIWRCECGREGGCCCLSEIKCCYKHNVEKQCEGANAAE